MNRLFLGSLCVILFLFSCKNTQENETAKDAKTNGQEIIKKDINKIDYIDFLLDEKTEAHTVDWQEYNEFQEVIDNFKKADLSFIIENKKAVSTTLENFKKNIPEPLNTAAITARINAFETKFLKLESLANLSSTSKAETLLCIKDVFTAFSNLNLQMNKKVEFDNQDIQKP